MIDQPPGLGLVRRRRLVEGGTDVTFALAAGDRPLVAVGESVVAGTPIIERVRDPRLVDRAVPASARHVSPFLETSRTPCSASVRPTTCGRWG
jgi:hypothetical protein